jgi:uncharacterized membrane protein
MDDETRYKQAKERVEALKGFYAHLAVYLAVNLGLILLSIATGGTWFVWPLFGWGIGLLAHAVAVFVIAGRFDSGWEERKIREYMQKDAPPATPSGGA